MTVPAPCAATRGWPLAWPSLPAEVDTMSAAGIVISAYWMAPVTPFTALAMEMAVGLVGVRCIPDLDEVGRVAMVSILSAGMLCAP